MATSFPFLALARDLCVPYADVCVWAGFLNGVSYTPNEFERRVSNVLTHEQKHAISRAVVAERDRRYAILKEMGLCQQPS